MTASPSGLKGLLHKGIATAFCCVILIALLFKGVFGAFDVRAKDALISRKVPLGSITILAIDDKSLHEIGRWPWSRSVISKLIDAVPQSSVIGVDIAFFESGHSPGEDDALAAAFAKKRTVLVCTKDGAQSLDEKLQLPIFNDTARGFADVITDGDGVTRATILETFEADGTKVEPFAVALYKEFFGTEPPLVRMQGRSRINFAGPARTFRTISAGDVLSGATVLPENNIIILGATAQSLKDIFQTPKASAAMSGAEVHANILQMIINQRTFEDVGGWWTALLILALAATAYALNAIGALFQVRIFSRPASATIVVAALGAAYIFTAVGLSRKDILLPMIYPLLSLAAAHAAVSLLDHIQSEREKSRIQAAFGKYVAPGIVEQIISENYSLRLGGEKRRIGILFADIRDFTSIAEEQTPQALVAMLNVYLSAMTEIIHSQRGMIDKYIGDAIMALWNVPLPVEGFEEKMARAALGMAETRVSNEIYTGIGLHVGDAVVGNIGSTERFGYTAIGDNVNIASRLEGLTKVYRVTVIASEDFVRCLPPDIGRRELDSVRVRGRSRPVVIYEICGDAPPWHQDFSEALAMYRSGLFEDAFEVFKSLSEFYLDYASSLFAERCSGFIQDRYAPREWSGVWEHTTK